MTRLSSALAGGTRLHGLVTRLASFLDQALISLGNFAITIALARIYIPEDFAGFGIGLAISLTLAGAYRTSFAVPNALLSESRFRRRARAIAAQHLLVVISLSALALAAIAIAWAFDPPPLVMASFLGFFATAPLYLSLESDRLLGFRVGGPLVPLAMSSLYLLLVGGVAAAGLWFGLPFPAAMLALGFAGLVKVVLNCLLPGRPDLPHGINLLGHRLRHTVGWASVGTVASAGFIHAPLWILSALAAPIHAAAYTAMRTPLQPMQILIRSFDLVDKIAFARIDPNDRAARARHTLRTYFVYLGIALVLASVATLAAAPLVHVLLGDEYLPFTPTLIAWAFNFVLIISMNPLETVVYEARQYRTYAYAQIAGGLLALALTAPLALTWQSTGAAIACICGLFIPYAWLLWRFIAYQRQARSA